MFFSFYFNLPCVGNLVKKWIEEDKEFLDFFFLFISSVLLQFNEKIDQRKSSVVYIFSGFGNLVKKWIEEKVLYVFLLHFLFYFIFCTLVKEWI